MRRWLLLVVVCAPLGAGADVSVHDPGDDGVERCLSAARRALARDYPHDDGDEHFCMRRPGELTCYGTCDDRSCHNDACESWRSRIEVHLDRSAAGRYDVRISDDAPPAQAARARRVILACVSAAGSRSSRASTR
jgi:hypothetical protein